MDSKSPTKKVFLTVSRGSIARNLLKNDFYKLLLQNYHVVVLTPAYKDERFLNEFAGSNVTFLYLGPKEQSGLDQLLFFFHKHLIYNSTVDQKSRWGIIGDPRSKKTSYPVYLVKRAIFSLLSKIPPLRDFMRWVDFLVTQRTDVNRWRDVIQQERPEVVISTNIADNNEVALLKAAKREGVKTIGMPKSWDNPSKHGFRVKVDKVVVWNELMADQMKRFQNYQQKEICKIGVPQFDYYLDKSRLLSRVEFCDLYGLDPRKKILMFCSEGKLFKTDGDIASVLYDALKRKKLDKECQLFIRPHFGYNDDQKKFQHLSGKTDVSIDLFYKPSKEFRDEWDYSNEAMNRFLNMLYHSDININTHSSLTLDAVCFDKPIISIMFDGFKKKLYKNSIARWYETYYYRQVLAFAATTEVCGPDDLISAINLYLSDSKMKKTQRAELRKAFCYKFDGGSGRRFFEEVRKMIE